MISTFKEFCEDHRRSIEAGETVVIENSHPYIQKFLDWLGSLTEEQCTGWLVTILDDCSAFTVTKQDSYRIPGENGWRND